MGSGVYEYTTSGGEKHRWVREADGSIRFWRENDQYWLRFAPLSWRGLVAAMATDPLPSSDVPLVGEIVGWRCWRVRWSDECLISLSRDHLWLPGDIQRGHVGEDKGGIYAFKTQSHAASEARKLSTEHDQPFVVGSIWLWGDVLEAADGYRAEYAAVRSINDVWKNNDMWAETRKTRHGRFGGLLPPTVTVETIPYDFRALRERLRNRYVDRGEYDDHDPDQG